MNVYEARHAGREYCNTEGSQHYKGGEVEPLDLIFALGYGEGFCMGSAIKYASRFKETRNLADMKKISDYAHILCGVELAAKEKKAADQFLVAKDFESIGKAEELCRERYLAKKCKTCQIGKNIALEQISCREYIEFYPKESVELLKTEVTQVDQEPTVREVKRPAKVGEWIKIDGQEPGENRYKNGQVFPVKNIDEYGWPYVEDDFGISPYEYVVLEGYGPGNVGE
jgi:hypothetical protein